MQDEINSIFDVVGAEGLARMTHHFYRRVAMDDLLRPMYPEPDLAGAEERLRDFLIFRFGGPTTYLETRGHPRLRMRHAPFPVGREARDHWFAHMDAAIADADLDERSAALLREFFSTTATFLINRV